MKYNDYLANKGRDPSHLCLYGPPKIGKSTLASQLAEPEHGAFKLIWCSGDNGHKVLEKLSKEGKDNIDEILIFPDVVDYPIFSESMTKILKGDEVKICDSHSKINCAACSRDNFTFTTIHLKEKALDTIVVVDHLKQLANSYTVRISQKSISEIKEASKRPLLEDYKFTWDDFRTLGAAMDRDLGYIQHAKYNVLAISHETNADMEAGGTKLVPLVGSGPYSRNVGGFFDHIVYCQLLNGAHKFGSKTSFSFTALTGSRTDVVIEEMKEPSLKAFFDGTVPSPKTAEEKAALEKAKAAVTQSSAADLLAKMKGKVTS